MIPALGMLVNSFRPAGRTVRARAGGPRSSTRFGSSWTIQNYSTVLDRRRRRHPHGPGVHQQLHRGGAGDGHPDPRSPPSPPTPSPSCSGGAGTSSSSSSSALLVVPNQVALVPLRQALRRRSASTGRSSRSGWPTSGSACRWRSTSCATTCPACHWPSSSRRRSTAPATSPRSGGSSCRCRCPALASFAIFQFLWVWNDLLVALIFLGRGDNTVATVALQGLQGQTGAGTELIPAAGFITIIVPILVFLSLQRYFIRGMTSGAVKG